MKLFRAMYLEGIYLGADAIIIAESEERARELLAPELIANHIRQKHPIELTEIDLSVEQAIVIDDGNY